MRVKTGPAAGRVPISMSFSSSEGVFTARETASHTDWRRVGVHSRRAVGWISTPVKSLCSKRDPRVRTKLSGSRVISLFTNRLKICGSRRVVGGPMANPLSAALPVNPSLFNR